VERLGDDGAADELLGALVGVRCVPGVLAQATFTVPSSACAASQECPPAWSALSDAGGDGGLEVAELPVWSVFEAKGLEESKLPVVERLRGHVGEQYVKHPASTGWPTISSVPSPACAASPECSKPGRRHRRKQLLCHCRRQRLR